MQKVPVRSSICFCCVSAIARFQAKPVMAFFIYAKRDSHSLREAMSQVTMLARTFGECRDNCGENDISAFCINKKCSEKERSRDGKSKRERHKRYGCCSS